MLRNESVICCLTNVELNGAYNSKIARVLAQLKERYTSPPNSILCLELFMNGVEIHQKVCIFPYSFDN